MDSLKQTIEVDIKLIPQKIAELFCSMDADEQAIFFNTIAADVETWPACNFDLQMQYISDSTLLTENGRKIMKTIGQYAEEQHP
ncbi:hypothetical protein [Mucilaginibacter sp.]|jgi:hypothetical protein|uniref:hypothetical protein n=1 Tax=Mucilaginibacter sp. TaxID=1882438 RepID=UPI00356B31F6